MRYANASAVATNGAAFAGLNANTPWFNVMLARAGRGASLHGCRADVPLG
ncbi:MAG: potassium-transporting ATPase subunit KdpA [Acidobacteriia bacterium]|nr:potassium-transporting ATPase subunit KdpA [Terriglobia bacterium]